MKKLIGIFSFVAIGCSCNIVKGPHHTIDSTIITKDTIRKQGDSVSYHKKEISIIRNSTYSLKPFIWYLLATAAGVILVIFIKK